MDKYAVCGRTMPVNDESSPSRGKRGSPDRQSGRTFIGRLRTGSSCRSGHPGPTFERAPDRGRLAPVAALRRLTKLRTFAMSESHPNRQQILDLMNGFRSACVIGAAAELDVWTALGGQSLLAEQLAKKLHTDLRATTILLDALAALGLLEKRDIHYSVPPDLRGWLVEESPETILPMLRHAMTILRSWSQLAWVAKSGIPAPRIAEHSRAGGRPRELHRRHARRFRSDGRRAGAEARPAEVPPSARRGRGVRHVDAGVSAGGARAPRPRFSTCPTPSSKPGIGWPARSSPIA